MAEVHVPGTRIDLDKPRYDQNTFLGRFKHFASITDMRTALCSEKELDDAKILYDQYKQGLEPVGTTDEQVWRAKKLYESAFHPDCGDKMNVIGRMSFQVPGGMLITGGMLQFYKSLPGVVLWQWINQSFNALVNYTNRNAKSEITGKQIGVAYVSATSAAMAVSLGLNSLVKKAAPLLARWVPFAAVAAANCINIPLMRQREVINGLLVSDENGNAVGCSRKAAVKSITQVCISRITMAAPGMIMVPILMEKLEKYKFMKRIRILHMPMQVMFVGVFLTFMVPTACAMFPQRCSLRFDQLEPELQEELKKSGREAPQRVFFNKGL